MSGVVSEKYRRLMNGRYDRIRATSPVPGAELELTYDGIEWTASLPVKRPGARDRYVTGVAPVLDRALDELEAALGLTRERA